MWLYVAQCGYVIFFEVVLNCMHPKKESPAPRSNNVLKSKCFGLISLTSSNVLPHCIIINKLKKYIKENLAKQHEHQLPFSLRNSLL